MTATAETTFTIKQGDTLPVLREQLLDENGDPLDLTDAEGIELHLVNRSTDVGNVVVDGSTNVSIDGDPTLGTVRYTWQTGDTDVIGSYVREWQVTYPGDQVVTVPNSRLGYPVEIVGQIA